MAKYQVFIKYKSDTERKKLDYIESEKGINKRGNARVYETDEEGIKHLLNKFPRDRILDIVEAKEKINLDDIIETKKTKIQASDTALNELNFILGKPPLNMRFEKEGDKSYMHNRRAYLEMKCEPGYLSLKYVSTPEAEKVISTIQSKITEYETFIKRVKGVK